MGQTHIIVGGGPAATNAIETIRRFESDASTIHLVCDEPAHSRMALPYWLAGKIPREHTHTGDDAYFEKLGVTTHFGERVTSVDPDAKSVTLTNGETLAYDDLLLATGSRPLELPIEGVDLPGVQPLWTLTDTQGLLDFVPEGRTPRVTMIGAGFIGFIMLNAMHKKGWKLSVVEREPHVLPRMLDPNAAAHVERWLTSKGVSLYCGQSVARISESGDGSKVVHLADGQTVETDAVIIATGIKPNIELAQDAGLEVDHGVLVNSRLQTSRPEIYAAGDIAQGPVLDSDEREVHAIQPTAVDHGRVAGANMAGRNVEYDGSLLMNILDVCGLQNASYGRWIDPDAEEMVISNERGNVYRKLLWTGDRITGAIFVGKPHELGMLTDVGMVKGMMQLGVEFGEWKEYLRENPFDIRRPFVALKVAQQLREMTLLGAKAEPRGYRFQNAEVKTTLTPAHAAYVDTKAEAESEASG